MLILYLISTIVLKITIRTSKFHPKVMESYEVRFMLIFIIYYGGETYENL